MVSLEGPPQATPKSADELIAGPRISFSAEFLDDDSFISICPNQERGEREIKADFEFLSGDSIDMITAEELISEGKLLPFWQTQQVEKLDKIASLKKADDAEMGAAEAEQNDQERRMSWFIDDDPSPRPPKCTVLWKELLRLKKQRQRASTPSPPPPSPSSPLSVNSSADERKKGGEREKMVNRVKKGLERTRSASTRIRPMINVPICTATKNTSLPPLFPLRRA